MAYISCSSFVSRSYRCPPRGVPVKTATAPAKSASASCPPISKPVVDKINRTFNAIKFDRRASGPGLTADERTKLLTLSQSISAPPSPIITNRMGSIVASRLLLVDRDERYALLDREGDPVYGEGGSNTVRPAVALHSGEHCVVRECSISSLASRMKVSREVVLEGLNREVSLGKLLRGIPGIVGIRTAAVSGDTFYSIMDYCPGGDLSHRIHRLEDVPLPKMLQWGESLVTSMCAMHERGILHRDIKPANVLFDGYDRAILSDFGSSTPVNDDGPWGIRQRCGTPGFIAPESLAGQSSTTKGDVLALGVTLFTMITGIVLPQHLTPTEQRTAITEALRRPSASRPELSKEGCGLLRRQEREAREIVADMVQLDPAKRPDSPEVSRRWKAMMDLGREPATAPAPSAPSPTSPSAPAPSAPSPTSSTSSSSAAPSPTSPTAPAPSAPSPTSSKSSDSAAPSPRSPAVRGLLSGR